MRKDYLQILVATCLFFISSLSHAQTPPGLEQNPQINSRGVWVTCFSEEKILYSKKKVLEFIEFLKNAKINQVYLQLYRSGLAYYDSKITDRRKYDELLKQAELDTIDFLLQQAHKNKIKVFAWINLLSLAENKTADILVKFGDSVLTKDQYLRPSARDEQANKSDKYYLRDKQLFLEPADPRVVQYLSSLVDEIITRYPTISGIHLDYIRYPYPVPYLPNSKFNKYGLTYGYGEESITGFKKNTGLNPLTMKDAGDNCLLWDNWKRESVTALVEALGKVLKNKSPDLLLSCAVISSPEQAYSIAFQDWPLWLEKGMVDYVVIMNYTRDNRLAQRVLKSALAQGGKNKVFTGIGVFLMRDEPDLFFQQYKILTDLKPEGIVFFSYDDIKRMETLPE